MSTSDHADPAASPAAGRWTRLWFPPGIRLTAAAVRVGIDRWFAPGGRSTAAAVRVAIAVSVLWTLSKIVPPDYAAVIARRAAALYHPVGILRLFGDDVPPAALLDGAATVAWIATLCMLVGFMTRLSTAVSLIASLIVVSFQYAFARHWSHSYNVVFLAQVAFVFVRSGDAWSVDRVIRAVRGRPSPDPTYSYQWAVRLAMFAVAAMFATAAMIKIRQDPTTWGWAFSDNLRHHLLMRFDWSGVERTELANWLLESPYRYQTAAFLNLINQLLPLAAFCLLHRPRLRFALGCLFVIETVSLGLVMDLWNLHWLPLAAVFVDWDRLLAYLAARAPRVHERAQRTRDAVYAWLARGRQRAGRDAWPWPSRRARRLLISVFSVAFITYYMVLAFTKGSLDVRLNTYPFSRFPMFAKIRAKHPYRMHQSYEMLGGQLAIDATPPLSDEARRWFTRRYRFLYRVRDRATLRKRLEAIARVVERRHRGTRVHGIELWLTVFQAPAYPEPAELRPNRIALIGTLRIVGDGTRFESMIGQPGRDATTRRRYLDVQAIGIEPTGMRIVYHPDDLPEPVPLATERRGDRFYFDEVQGHGQVFVIVADEAGAAPRSWYLTRTPYAL